MKTYKEFIKKPLKENKVKDPTKIKITDKMIKDVINKRKELHKRLQQS